MDHGRIEAWNEDKEKGGVERGRSGCEGGKNLTMERGVSEGYGIRAERRSEQVLDEGPLRDGKGLDGIGQIWNGQPALNTLTEHEVTAGQRLQPAAMLKFSLLT